MATAVGKHERKLDSKVLVQTSFRWSETITLPQNLNCSTHFLFGAFSKLSLRANNSTHDRQADDKSLHLHRITALIFIPNVITLRRKYSQKKERFGSVPTTRHSEAINRRPGYVYTRRRSRDNKSLAISTRTPQ
ncbi:hypothetical protein T265_07320 [Opisthorchis viverrini]|uniref:Uncharacterized protein n=1 Tax=Opisthorchis viverrini TaxID=6198 RepID=A0A074ZD25_OPIVI|nr:hypothetical protein T265_07320 [Opisthorchis viverrini]KER25156.1 hypothetical protein T265_07320 [Opisthorchis viverrini]